MFKLCSDCLIDLWFEDINFEDIFFGNIDIML